MYVSAYCCLSFSQVTLVLFLLFLMYFGCSVGSSKESTPASTKKPGSRSESSSTSIGCFGIQRLHFIQELGNYLEHPL
jgi:hypothetical protein